MPSWRGRRVALSLEGMLLEIPNAVAVSGTNRFGEIWVLGDLGKFASGINSRGGITVRGRAKGHKWRDDDDKDDDNRWIAHREDFNPERIQIDDGIFSGATDGVNVNDFLGNVVGVLSYDFENFELDTLTTLHVTPGNLKPEITKLSGKLQQLTIGTFNVENLDPSDDARFDDLAEIIVHNLQAPDILALQEEQDNKRP